MARPQKIEVNQGEKFGHLTVLQEQPQEVRWGQSYRIFMLRCDCDNVVTKTLHDLRINKIRSCGYKCPFRFADRQKRSNKYA